MSGDHNLKREPCKCEHWEFCSTCMPDRFDRNGKLFEINLNHLVLDGNHNKMVCKHCKRTYKIDFPIAVDMLAAIAESFIREHNYCQEGDADELGST